MLLPVRPVTKPKVLDGQLNGRLDPAILKSVPGLAGGPTVRLVEPAATGWRALTTAAQKAGHILKATSAVDSYRPYDVQERTFLARYTTVPIAGVSTRTWQGKTWYLKPGNAPAAAPGTSNHGWGLAVDTGEERDADAQAESLDLATLTWLVDHELNYGFSHEIQEENWHIRWYVGDDIPLAVRAFMIGEVMAGISPEDQEVAIWRIEAILANRPTVAGGPKKGEVNELHNQLAKLETMLSQGSGGGGLSFQQAVDAAKTALREGAGPATP